jgi:DHA1 family tetracycline resistance protein-like MFS transporter
VALSRAGAGAVDGSVSVANAYIADVTDEKDRKAGFGRLGAAWSLGFVVGPALAGFLARDEGGVTTVVVLAMLLSTAGAAVVAWMLPELPVRGTHLDMAGSACAHKALGGGARECTAPPPSAEWRRLSGIPRLPALLVVYFLVFLGFSVFTAVFPVHAVDDLGWSSHRLGLFFTLLSLALVVTQSLILPALGRRLGEPMLAFAGSLLVALGYLLMVWSGDASTFIAGALYGVGNGLMWPAYLTLFSEAGPASLQGTIQGVGSSVGSGAAIVGTLGGGVLYTNVGARAFFVPAAILAVTALLCLRLGPPASARLGSASSD